MPHRFRKPDSNEIVVHLILRLRPFASQAAFICSDKAGAKILLASINKLNAVTLVLERVWEAEILPSPVFALVLISW